MRDAGGVRGAEGESRLGSAMGRHHKVAGLEVEAKVKCRQGDPSHSVVFVHHQATLATDGRFAHTAQESILEPLVGQPVGGHRLCVRARREKAQEWYTVFDASRPLRTRLFASCLCVNVVSFPQKKKMAASAAAPKAKRKRDAKLGVSRQLDESSAGSLGLPQVTPSVYCTLLAHPFGTNYEDRTKLSHQAVDVMELFIPSNRYRRNPKGLLPDFGPPDQQLFYRRAILAMAHCALMLSAPKKFTNEDDEVEVSTAVSTVMTTWERVPKKGNPTEYVGYRLRYTQHASAPGRGFSGELADLLRSNYAASIKKLSGSAARGGGGSKKPKFAASAGAPSPTSLIHITPTEWKKMTTFYGGRKQIDNNEATLSDDVASRQCAWNILNVFSVERSLELARRSGADPRYCDSHTYKDQYRPDGSDGKFYGFADAANVWRIDPTDIDPVSLLYPVEKLFMPMHRADPKLHTTSRAEWEILHPGEGDIWDGQCNRTAGGERAHDVHGITEEVRADKAALEAKWKGCDDANSNGYWRDYRRAQAEWNSRMGEIIHPSGDAAPAIQRIALFRDAWLEANENSLCLPREHTMRNLTRFEDFWARHATILSTVGTVLSIHKIFTLCLLSALHVYARVDMNVHQLMLGFPGAGKSFCMKLVEKLLIVGTTLSLSSMTPKALMVPGKVNDCLYVHAAQTVSSPQTTHSLLSMFVSGF